MTWYTPNFLTSVTPNVFAAAGNPNNIPVFNNVAGTTITMSPIDLVYNTSSTYGNNAIFSVDTTITTNTTVGIQFQPLYGGAFIVDVANGTNVTGISRGTNAIDLQLFRSGATQVAAGNYSALIGGEQNTIATTATDSVILGGNSNLNSAAQSGIIGGVSNTNSGSQSVVVGGSSNTNSGVQTSMIGGSSNISSGNQSAMIGGSSNMNSGIQSAMIGELLM